MCHEIIKNLATQLPILILPLDPKFPLVIENLDSVASAAAPGDLGDEDHRFGFFQFAIFGRVQVLEEGSAFGRVFEVVGFGEEFARFETVGRVLFLEFASKG